jgi:hypothetical protein
LNSWSSCISIQSPRIIGTCHQEHIICFFLKKLI